MAAWVKQGLAAASIALAACAAQAQESTNRVAAETDWSVYIDDNPTECWSVATPARTINTDTNGNPKTVNRGKIYLLVFHRPSQGIKDLVQFAGGYPFQSGSKVLIEISGRTFELDTDGENAWPNPSDDSAIISAMKAGADAVVTGRSARGTITKDTFSLRGFTAALQEAQKRCAN